MEGDCQALIGRLKVKATPNKSLGYFILEILILAESFDFIEWNFIKRECNKVAHAMAHLQPLAYHKRIWEAEGPDDIYNLAAKDMCTFINQSLI